MKHTEQIERIKEVARAGGKETGVAQAISEFAVLLGTLAEEADSTAEKNLKISENNIVLQRWTFSISIILFLISAVQLILVITDRLHTP